MLLAKYDKDYGYDVKDLDNRMSLFGQDFWVDDQGNYNFEISNVHKIKHVNLWALKSHEDDMRDFRIGRLSNRARNGTSYETKDLHVGG